MKLTKEQRKEIAEAYYYYKAPNGTTWVGYSIAHNKEQEKIVEKTIRERIKKAKMKTLYKKVKNKKIEKRWNW